MPTVFVLTGNRAGRTELLNHRYSFIDGVMTVNDDEDAKKLSPILCGFFACKSMSLEEYEAGRPAISSAKAPAKADPAEATPAKDTIYTVGKK